MTSTDLTSVETVPENTRKIAPGVKVLRRHGGEEGQSYVYRVMAVADGWAMLRYPRAVPFAERVRDLEVWDG